MSRAAVTPAGADAILSKGWLGAHRYLLLRRATQVGILLIFLAGPWFGIWIAKGNLVSSLTLDVLPLTDPFVLLQSVFAGHWPATTALVGALIVAGFYAAVSGRLFCSWVCPINPVTDAAAWLHSRLALPAGWQPKKSSRLWLLGIVAISCLITGQLVWELINPVSMLHRGLFFGLGMAWMLVIGVFVFDLLVSRRGWCGRLCPMGAFYGLLGSGSLLRVSAAGRDACNDCMDCFAVCPENHVITPALRGKDQQTPVITSHDCTSCGRCIDICSKDVFRFTHRFDHTVVSTEAASQPLTRGEPLATKS